MPRACRLTGYVCSMTCEENKTYPFLPLQKAANLSSTMRSIDVCIKMVHKTINLFSQMTSWTPKPLNECTAKVLNIAKLILFNRSAVLHLLMFA